MKTRPCNGGHTLHLDDEEKIVGISDSLWPIISIGDIVMSVGGLGYLPPLGTRGIIEVIQEPFTAGRTTDIYKVRFPGIKHLVAMKQKDFWTQVSIGQTIVGPLAQNFKVINEVGVNEAWDTVLTVCPNANVAGQKGVGVAEARQNFRWQKAFGIIVEINDSAETAIMYDGQKYLKVQRPLL